MPYGRMLTAHMGGMGAGKANTSRGGIHAGREPSGSLEAPAQLADLVPAGELLERRSSLSHGRIIFAASLDDYLAQLGVDASERPEHGGETTGETLARGLRFGRSS